MRTLDPNEFVYEDEASLPSLASVSSTEPKPVSDFTFEEEPSKVMDVLRGGAQGLTFGFSDEALAALKAATEVAGTEKTLKDLPSLYRQYQQLEQEKVKQAKERSPIAFGAAEIAGGLAPALFTGGGTAAATAAKGFLPAVGRGALTGAKYGALAAAGTAEAPIEETGEFAKEIGKGALFGGTLGGVLGGIGETGRKLLSSVEDVDLGRQMKAQYEQLKKPDVELFGSKAKTAQVESESQLVREIQEQLLSGQSSIGENIRSILKEAKDIGIKIGEEEIELLKTQIKKDPFFFESKDRAKVLPIIEGIGKKRVVVSEGYLEKLRQGTLSPEEANEFRKILKNVVEAKRNEPGNAATVELAKRLDKTLLDSLKANVKGYEKALNEYDLYTAATIETILGKGTYARDVAIKDIGKEAIGPAPIIKSSERFFSNISEGATVLQRELKEIIEKLATPGLSSRDRIETITQLEKNLSALKEFKPELLKTAKIDPDALIQKIKKEADISAGYTSRFGYEPQSGFFKQLAGFITPRGASLTGAAAAGKVVGAAQRSAPVRLASKVYSAAEPELRKISEALIQNEATKRFGQNLAASLDKPGGVARRAVLFSIMQSPDARKAISGLYPGFGEE